MKKLITGLFLLNLSTASVFAIEIEEGKRHYLRDSDHITNVRVLPISTLVLNRDITVKNSVIDQENNYFQNGKQVSAEKLDDSKPYCNLIVTAKEDMFKENEEAKPSYKLNADTKLLIQGPLINIEKSSEMNFDKKLLKITGIKSSKREYNIELLVNKNIATDLVDEVAYKVGDTSKRYFKDIKDDKESAGGSLKCHKFTSMPTVGDVRAILGSGNIGLLPDSSDPQKINSFEKFEQYEEADDSVVTEADQQLINMLNEKITALIQTLSSAEVEKLLSDSNVNDTKGKKVVETEKLMNALEKINTISK